MINRLCLVSFFALMAISVPVESQFTYSTNAEAESVECCNSASTAVLTSYEWRHSTPPVGLRGSLLAWVWSRALVCVGGDGISQDNGIQVISNNANYRTGMFGGQIQCPFGLRSYATFGILGTPQFPRGFFASDSSACRAPCSGSHCLLGEE